MQRGGELQRTKKTSLPQEHLGMKCRCKTGLNGEILNERSETEDMGQQPIHPNGAKGLHFEGKIFRHQYMVYFVLL